MSKESVKIVKKAEIPNIKAEVKAIDKGYYKGQIIEVGVKFIYDGPVCKKNEGLPLWVEVIKIIEKPKEAKKDKSDKDEKASNKKEESLV